MMLPTPTKYLICSWVPMCFRANRSFSHMPRWRSSIFNSMREIREGVEHVEEFLNDKNVRSLRIDFVERIITIIIAGLGLIAVLAWDDALKHLFHEIFVEESTLVQEFLYAIALTVLAS